MSFKHSQICPRDQQKIGDQQSERNIRIQTVISQTNKNNFYYKHLGKML